MKNERILVIIVASLLMTTVLTFNTTPSSFAQDVDNEGVEEEEEEEDTTNIDNALTKLKNSIICNIAGPSSNCDQESQAGIEIGEEVQAPPPTPSPPPTDSDNDGVSDTVDGCPNQPGPAANNGCDFSYSI
ncbi:MAG TPA: hypothetical protein VIP70_07265 [Nitrososphaeraceae archaeon]